MIVHSVEQGSPEWFNIRVGVVTMSNLDQIITPKTMKPSASQDGYMNKLLAELYYGHPLDTFQSAAMANGVDMEPEAVKSYEFRNDCETERIGFVTNDAGTIGCSPDRFIVGSKDMLEVKCPEPHTHVGYLRGLALADAYWCQLQGQLWVCEKDKAIIISYNRKMPMVEIEVLRNEEFIQKAALYTDSFLERFAQEKRKWGLPDRITTPVVSEEQTSPVTA